jgi:hypothetical protein
MLRRRSFILLALAVVLLVGVELTLRRWTASKVCVQIINQGDSAMDDLVVDYAGTKITLGRLTVGQSTQTWLSAGPKGPLRLDFRQKSNGMRGFQVPDFDPAQNLEDGFKLVLIVKTNEIVRFMEDDDSQKAQNNWGDRIRQWMSAELVPPK